MEKTAENIPRYGYLSTVSSYLMVDNIEEQLDFLGKIFQIEIMEELINREDNTIMHAEVLIGDSSIMMGKATGEYPSHESMLYVLIEDVDEAYRLAMENGAESLREPVDQLYGYREAGVKDPLGNQWWLATQIEELSQEEIQKRMDQR